MRFDAVTVQVLWNRVVAIVDEAAQGLIRTAYTPSVKEYHDFCCAVFDERADMLAHSTVTTAGFLGIVPEVMRNFLKDFPADTLKPGDVIITNDPWAASGHLIDISVASPIFHRDRLVGFTLCIVHHLDMGGRMSTLESKDMYEEGLKIPIMKLYEEGKLNPAIYAFMRANIRVPEKVLGDLRAQLVANNVCTRGVQRLLEESGLEDLSALGAEITARSERSLRRKIAALPDGTWHTQALLPPLPVTKEQILIKVALSIAGEQVTIDFTGTSGEVRAAVNCTLNMTRSYASYPIKLALDPNVPNNDGCMRAITIIAPEGTAVNSRPPASTWGRTMISHLLAEVIYGALEQVLPEAVLGGNGGCPANEIYLHGRRKDGSRFLAISQHSGGFGGSTRQDGWSTLCFPNNTANIPVEVTEREAAMIYRRKEFVPDSAGPGRFRGGLGQAVEFEIIGEDLEGGYVEGSVRLNGRTEDGSFPIFGRAGGKPGRGGGLWVDGQQVEHGIYRRFLPGQRVRFTLGGGGGYGDPMARDPAAVLDDLRAGKVTAEGALRDYGVVLTRDGAGVDAAATDKQRRGAR
ncbi:MAG: hydantoinase B/oxoprolinase family protein [Alphaproteobacteria bacterium]|nr:hydantoinase B/oxoprolinase family protein [Alphaproteobacteria bacterium]